MRRKIDTALASSVVALALIFVGPAGASASHDGHHSRNDQQVSGNTRRAEARANRRPKAGKKKAKKTRRRAISFVCPMHPDIREKRRGTCPKCLMDLVAEPRIAKGDASDNTK